MTSGRLQLSFEGETDTFPEGHTCGFGMSLPIYTSKEKMKKNLITAITLCGEVDADGYDSDAFNNDTYL